MHALQHLAETVAADVDGRLGICVLDLETGAEYGVRLDEPMPMASVCKIPLLVTLFRDSEGGRLDLGQRAAVRQQDHVGGSGLLSAMAPGIAPTLRDLAVLMIAISDNTATDLLFRAAPPAAVTAVMRGLGLPGIRLGRTIRELLDDIGAALDPALRGVHPHQWEEQGKAHPGLCDRLRDADACREAVNAVASGDTATPRDMARLCAMIARGQAAGPEACERMLEVLDTQLLNGRLPRDLPALTRLPHKTGSLGIGAVVNDAGILYIGDRPAAAISALSCDVRSPAHHTNGQLARLGRGVYDHFAARAARD